MKRLRIADWGLRIGLAAALATVTLCAAPAENNAVLKRQMQEVERALLRMFEVQSLIILQEPKSAYLPGFGIVVHAEVNLYPMRNIMPFAPQPYSEQELKTEREQKLLRLRTMQKQLQELLLAQSRLLTQVNGEENLALVIHLYNPRSYPGIPSQVVVQARRQALLSLQEQARKPGPDELAKVILVREF